MQGVGTIINVATIVAGTVIGLLVGRRLPDRLRVTILQGVGLIVIALGLGQVITTDNIVFPLVAIVGGTVVGELLRVEERLEAVGERLRRRFERDREGDSPSTFVEGFVAASLLFVVGPMAILGSIQDGLNGDIGLLAVKSSLDGLVSVVFAATLGWGVGFSALPVLLYQGAMTLLAGTADAVLSDRMILEMSATGGVMIMGIGLRLLDLAVVRVGSMLPGLLLAPLLVSLFAR
ncbi:MAG TPA: DUF554 domain-containing protein [Actinomycetota bacterium]|nr:DUF554 domain-containing protein [Actinomycetota bacterium]HVM07577.1 DUF554 domain-containing protein [Acidimicrobiales bacterium]